MPFHNDWFIGAKTEEERENIRTRLKGYKNTFSELTVLLERRRKDPAVTDYDTPGWANRQIAVNEYNRALDDLLKLLKEGN